MRSTHRAVRSAIGVTTGLALALSGALPASAATWTLRDVNQRICVAAQYGHPGTYFLAPVVGSWSTTITTGVRNLPPGSSSVGGTPIPPGSNYGTNVNGFVQVTIAPAPVGEYSAEVWASDGAETQSVPVAISIRDSC
ncbi:DUF5980 family protein [Microbispora sp. NPDC049125]|uniref:DUF5980 family protein n=1 Tax=Microbispora sp. NPDC049125 TaxID=3154929 RepID=UPI0034676891